MWSLGAQKPEPGPPCQVATLVDSSELFTFEIWSAVSPHFPTLPCSHLCIPLACTSRCLLASGNRPEGPGTHRGSKMLSRLLKGDRSCALGPVQGRPQSCEEQAWKASRRRWVGPWFPRTVHFRNGHQGMSQLCPLPAHSFALKHLWSNCCVPGSLPGARDIK